MFDGVKMSIQENGVTSVKDLNPKIGQLIFYRPNPDLDFVICISDIRMLCLSDKFMRMHYLAYTSKYFFMDEFYIFYYQVFLV